MRLSHILRTAALAATVSATALAAAGAAAAHTPIDDPRQFGDWIADVERPTGQHRSRYQLKLDEARSLVARGPGA